MNEHIRLDVVQFIFVSLLHMFVSDSHNKPE